MRAAVLLLAALLLPLIASAQSSLTRLSEAITPGIVDRDVLRQQRVDLLSPEAVMNPERSRVLDVDLFRDVSLRLVRDRLEPTAHGSAWFGRAEGYPESDAIFVLVGDELVGHLFTPFGFFRLQREADGSYLVQQVAPPREPEPDDTVPTDDPLEHIRPLATTSGPDDGSVIDVLVAYTTSARAGFGSDTRALAVIDTLVAETNRALKNTGVNTRVRLTQTAAVTYPETGDSSVDLDRLQNPSDGFMDDVPVARDLYAADLTVLITDRMDDACGRAWVSCPRNDSR